MSELELKFNRVNLIISRYVGVLLTLRLMSLMIFQMSCRKLETLTIRLILINMSILMIRL